MADAPDQTFPKPDLAERLRDAAARALDEADARRKADPHVARQRREIDGPKGPEPVRYGDWDIKGRASDF